MNVANGWVICVGVCDRMNKLYLPVEETEIVCTSVKVYCACVNSLRRSLNVSSYSQGKAEWRTAFCEG